MNIKAILLGLAIVVLATTASAIIMGEIPYNIVLRMENDRGKPEYFVKELDRSFDTADITSHTCYKEAEASDWQLSNEFNLEIIGNISTNKIQYICDVFVSRYMYPAVVKYTKYGNESTFLYQPSMENFKAIGEKRKSVQQAGPGYPPQGVGSPDP